MVQKIPVDPRLEHSRLDELLPLLARAIIRVKEQLARECGKPQLSCFTIPYIVDEPESLERSRRLERVAAPRAEAPGLRCARQRHGVLVGQPSQLRDSLQSSLEIYHRVPRA